MKFITPVEVSPSTGSWLDVDVTSHVGADAGDIAGVLLLVRHNDGSSSDGIFGVRKNGSSDTRTGALYRRAAAPDTGATYIAVGVDSNDVFEAYINSTDVDIYLYGYVMNSEGSFFTNLTEQENNSNEDAWYDMDISSATGGDTAVAAFFHVDRTASGSLKWGLRQNGSTDNRSGFITGDGTAGGFMGVDGSEILEYYRAAAGSPEFYLAGYLTSDITTFANAKDYSTGSTGTYVDADMSSDIPSGNNCALFDFNDGDTFSFNHATAIRKNGASHDYYNMMNNGQQYGAVEIDTNRIAEQKIEDVDSDLFIWGYGNESSGTNTNDERSAKVTGKTTDNDERAAKIVGRANAITLNGSTQYAKILNFTALDNLTGDVTLEIWAKQDASSGAYSRAFSLGDGTDRHSYLATENGVGSSGVNFGVVYSGTNADGYKSSGVFDTGTWRHVALVGFEDAKSKIYKDGTEITYNLQQTPSGSVQDPTGMDVFVGVAHNLADYFKGDISCFRVWNRSLPQWEIDLNKDKYLDPSRETGLIVQCRVDDYAQGSTLDNDATAGEDATLFNSPTWISTGPTITEKTYTDVNDERAAKLTGVGDVYTKERKASLPTDDANLANTYTSQEETDVGTSDDTRVDQDAETTGYIIHQYKNQHSNNSDSFSITWEGQTTIPPTSATVYLQVYNQNSTTWETLDSDNSTGEDTDFTLAGSITSSQSNYYATGNVVSVRVYQQVS